jgi:serine/threonine-protein kinase
VLDWTVPGYRGVRELRRGTATGGLAERTVLGIHTATGLTVLLRYVDGTLPEGQLLARREDSRRLVAVRSAHVAGLYEWVETDRGVAGVREYVTGASVRSVMRGSRLASAAGLVTLRAGLVGLAAAHELGLTHRGYKPENLLVDNAGTVRVADFAMSTVESAEEPAADVRAAFTIFVTCLTGGTDAGKLPRKLRGLGAVAATGDGATLLSALDTAAVAAVGADWTKRGQAELAKLVAKTGSTGSGKG